MQTLSSISYRFLRPIVGALLAFGVLTSACAADDTPEAFIKRLSSDVIDAIKADKSLAAGDINKVIVLVDQKGHAQREFFAYDSLCRGSQLAPSHTRATKALARRIQNFIGTYLFWRFEPVQRPSHCYQTRARCAR
jgi:phospholipid transport system substrate-binding protein